MITVTLLDGESVVVNAALIELIETTPDTVVVLATGRKVMVRENAAEVVNRVIAYQQQIGHPVILPLLPDDDEDADGNE